MPTDATTAPGSARAPAPVRARCVRCDASVPLAPHVWRCPACGGAAGLPDAPLPQVPLTGQGVWRYAPWLPAVGAPVSLGEPTTPLVDVEWDGDVVTLKLEGALPTGSFKDRGAALLVSWLRAEGARAVVEDSSGNAGAALAAYCARAGIRCDVYVPASAPATKLAQLRAHGATPVLVRGPRPAATAAARGAVADGAIYASHAYNPLYRAGTRTFAYELWEQLGGVPDVVVLPVGGGALLLGAHQGFRALRDAGLADRVPRLVAAQAAACAPLVVALRTGRSTPEAVVAQPSLADGIQVPDPLRGAEMLRAIRETDGTAVAVAEDAIRAAHARAGRRGVLLERTSAVALAALGPAAIRPGERVVVAATGHGLKTPTSPTPRTEDPR